MTVAHTPEGAAAAIFRYSPELGGQRAGRTLRRADVSAHLQHRVQRGHAAIACYQRVADYLRPHFKVISDEHHRAKRRSVNIRPASLKTTAPARVTVVANDTVVAVNQKGRCARICGTDRRVRTAKITPATSAAAAMKEYANWIPDLFMKREELCPDVKPNDACMIYNSVRRAAP